MKSGFPGTEAVTLTPSEREFLAALEAASLLVFGLEDVELEDVELEDVELEDVELEDVELEDVEVVTITPAGLDALDRAVYVGRGTPWGNPFHMRSERDRDRVCDQFEVYARERLARQPEWLDPLLGASVLVCHCAPRRCHADFLIELVEAIKALRAEWEKGEE